MKKTKKKVEVSTTKKIRYKYKDFINEYYSLLQSYNVNVNKKDVKKLEFLLRACHTLGGEASCRKFLENMKEKLEHLKTLKEENKNV